MMDYTASKPPAILPSILVLTLVEGVATMTKANKIDMTNPANVLESFKSADSNSYCASKLGQAIRSEAKKSALTDARQHALAFAIMDRAAAHNDCSLAGELVTAMPKGARRNDLIAWFVAFSNVRIKLDKETGRYKSGLCSKNDKSWRDATALDAGLKEAWDRPFYSVEEAKRDANPFDSKAFAAAVAKLIKRAQADNAQLSDTDKAVLADMIDMSAKLDTAKA